MALPDFLCIGAQKAGTTWLYKNLQHHPEIALPPLKEINYFNRSSTSFFRYLLKKKRRRDMIIRWFKSSLSDLVHHPYHLYWHIQFYMRFRDNNWYADIFNQRHNQISGDITPAYAKLSEEKIHQVHQLLPDVRIIYILRNPVDRIWSQAAMYFDRLSYSGLAHARQGEIDKFLKKQGVWHYSDYLTTIQRWQKFYDPSQMMILFFEDIVVDPNQVLLDVYNFLGVTPSTDYIPVTSSQKVHHRQYVDMPSEVRKRITQELYPQLVALHEYFGNPYTQQWLDQAE